MTALKSLVLDYLPPALVRQLRKARSRGIQFDGPFDSWAEAKSRSTGYDAQEILEKVLAATLKVKVGEAAFERDSVLFDKMEYSWPLLAGLMWAAARNGGKLEVLDFGGALGSSYFQNRALLQTLPRVRWNVVEQAHYVEAGRRHIQDDRLRFYETIDQCLAEVQPNVILLSSVLQYLDSPFELLEKLSSIGASVLLIDRTPFIRDERDLVLVQRVPESIYAASYPMRLFADAVFMKRLEQRWRLIATNLSPEGYVRTSRGIEFNFQGMMLESRSC